MVSTAERWPALGGKFRTCTDRIIAEPFSYRWTKIPCNTSLDAKNNMTFASMSEALTVESVESQAIYLIISVCCSGPVGLESPDLGRVWAGQGLKIFRLPLCKGFYMSPIFRNLHSTPLFVIRFCVSTVLIGWNPSAWSQALSVSFALINFQKTESVPDLMLLVPILGPHQ
jgi:hypothetical protein